MKRSSADDESAALKIGAVARLTGVSVHTLRKWEDRYGAVEPQRTERGERVYTRTDLKRLGYIKRLAHTGLSLRRIAGQTLDELENAWEQASGMQMKSLGPVPTEKVRVALLGQALPTLIERQGATGRMLDVVASGDSQESLAAAVGEEAFDILIYECPSITPSSAARVAELLRAFSVRCAIVVYEFGARAHIASIRSANAAVLRAPVDCDEIEKIARGLLFGVARAAVEQADGPSIVAEAEAPAPRLSRQTVARIASTTPQIRCECPNHLADIVLSLRAFEEYSQECENRDAEDAELHHYLWLSAAQARAHFEDAIVRVAELEGISLDEGQ